ncbi:flagellar hook-length control protein FliK [Heyndrickxia acidiproducens]|uniref:flagellar hook-length control protein FliK n=1 Tax=Heyndrickxia acidiproducens TaxID=1121084 RepID=UPI000370BA37|nr:flagellar hook-length control protein FliK [Heyndrickxia acidiproducens]
MNVSMIPATVPLQGAGRVPETVSGQSTSDFSNVLRVLSMQKSTGKEEIAGKEQVDLAVFQQILQWLSVPGAGQVEDAGSCEFSGCTDTDGAGEAAAGLLDEISAIISPYDASSRKLVLETKKAIENHDDTGTAAMNVIMLLGMVPVESLPKLNQSGLDSLLKEANAIWDNVNAADGTGLKWMKMAEQMNKLSTKIEKFLKNMPNQNSTSSVQNQPNSQNGLTIQEKAEVLQKSYLNALGDEVLPKAVPNKSMKHPANSNFGMNRFMVTMRESDPPAGRLQTGLPSSESQAAGMNPGESPDNVTSVKDARFLVAGSENEVSVKSAGEAAAKPPDHDLKQIGNHKAAAERSEAPVKITGKTTANSSRGQDPTGNRAAGTDALETPAKTPGATPAMLPEQLPNQIEKTPARTNTGETSGMASEEKATPADENSCKPAGNSETGMGADKASSPAASSHNGPLVRAAKTRSGYPIIGDTSGQVSHDPSEKNQDPSIKENGGSGKPGQDQSSVQLKGFALDKHDTNQKVNRSYDLNEKPSIDPNVQVSHHQMAKTEQFTLYTGADENPVSYRQFISDFAAILHRASYSNRLGSSRLMIRLRPENMGSLQVELTEQNGQLTAKIITNTSAAKDLLDSHLQQLKQAFAGQHIDLGQMNVIYKDMPQQTSDMQQPQNQEKRQQQENKKKEQNGTDHFSSFLKDQLFETEA